MRMRSDLVCISREIGGVQHWIIKDPIRLTYHDYVDRTYYLLSLFNGSRSISEIKIKFQERFGSELLERELNTCVSTFVRDEVVVVDSKDDGQRLFSRNKQLSKKGWSNYLSNPLAIKLPGWNLTTVFDQLMPLTKWAVRPLSFVVISLLGMAAIILVALNSAEVFARLPMATEFFVSQNIISILFCLSAIKLIHEFSHAMVCRHLGAECHEVGLMFLVFTPCMYCDVSDSWMIQSKWKRIAIAIAGIATDVFLASIATILWWFSDPGVLNSFCLNIMFIAGLGSVLFNANPLLRYDGYFVLSDLVGIPNLWIRSKEQMLKQLNGWLWGIESNESSEHPNKWLLFAYGVCSFLYRILIVSSILYFILTLLTANQLDLFAALLILFAIWGLLLKPVMAYTASIFGAAVHGRLSRWRSFVTLFLLIAGASVISFWPLPYWISVPAYTELRNADRLYVKTPGVLISQIDYGSAVKPDQVVAEFESYNLQLQREDISGKIAKNLARVQALEALRIWRPEVGDQLPTLREVILSLQQSLTSIEAEIKSLKVRSRRSGILIEPRTLRQNASDNSSQVTDELGFWSENPLTSKNLGAFFETGIFIGLVGEPKKLDCYALVRQENVDLIRIEQAAEIQLSNSPNRIMTGTVKSISLLKEAELPIDVKDFLISRYRKEIQMSEVESGKVYLARIEMKDDSKNGLNFESARTRIRVPNCTLLKRFTRFVSRTFSSTFD